MSKEKATTISNIVTHKHLLQMPEKNVDVSTKSEETRVSDGVKKNTPQEAAFSSQNKQITVKNTDGNVNLDPIPVVFITDNGYVVPTSVAITSLICNKKPSTQYSIFILTNELSEENKKRFKSFNSDDIKLEVITVSTAELESLHKYEANTICQATPAALLKFKLPTIFNDYKKNYIPRWRYISSK